MFNLIKLFENHFTKNKIIHHTDSNGKLLRALIPSEPGSFPIVLEHKEEEDRWDMSCFYPLRVTSEQQAAVFEILHRMNHHIGYGIYLFNFECNLFGHIASIQVNEVTEEDEDCLNGMLFVATITVARIMPVIHQVLYSAQKPEKAIETLLQKEAQEASESEDLTNPKNRLLGYMPEDPSNN